MNSLEDIKREPWRFDFFAAMRRIERSFPDRPRIGDSSSARHEYLALGQEPYMDFPASNLAKVDQRPDGRLRILTKFLGLLGPQGALPLATTEEVHSWILMRDEAFPRFLDLLNNRFLQLFFRAWADARPIAQRDRPKDDRFVAYVGSAIGLGSPIFHALDTIPDAGKLSFAGLIAARTKSSSRLRSLIGGLFSVKVEIDELVGSHLKLEAGDRTYLGQANAGLGNEILVGASVFSVQDKMRIRIFAKICANTRSFSRRAAAASHWRISYISTSVTSLSGKWSWRYRPMKLNRYSSPNSVNSVGQRGWVATRRRRNRPIVATPAFIPPS